MKDKHQVEILEENAGDKKKKKSSAKDLMVKVIMGISIIYLLNPTFGFVELLPDKLPVVGNIDEGVATALLLSGLKYFGYNFTDIFKRKKDLNA